MKPYSYGGKRHSNMKNVWKWARERNAPEPGRRTSRNSNDTVARRHNDTNSAARAAARLAILESNNDR